MALSNSIQQLFVTLENFEVISFDVFDTLVVRSTFSPKDTFDLVEKISLSEKKGAKFAKFRAIAEKEANSVFPGNPTFDEIYCTLQSIVGMGDDELSELKKLELEVENSLLIPRRDIRELFNLLIKRKKRIVLISDMYFSSAQIRRFLLSHGFDATFCEIFVSCEEGARKSSGELWRRLIKKISVESWIHLGDDLIGDQRFPKKFGIKVLSPQFTIRSPRDCFLENDVLRSRLGKYVTGSIYDRLILGHLLSEYVFNNAFPSESNTEENLTIVGGWLGPILAEFIDFVSLNSKNKKLLFVTREGYTLKPLFEKFSRLVGAHDRQSVLFYASRVSTSLASSTDFEKFSLLADTPFEGTIDEFFQNKLGLSTPNAQYFSRKYKLPSQKKDFLRDVKFLYPFVSEEAKKQNSLFRKYLKEAKEDLEPCIVDIGFSGRTQFNLSEACECKVSGIYLMLDRYHLVGQKNCPEKHLLSTPNVIYENLPYFEAALQVREQSVLRLAETSEGKIFPVFTQEPLTSKVIPEGCSYADGFVEFVGRWKKRLKGNFIFSKEIGGDIWFSILEANLLPKRYLSNLTLEDKFSGLGFIRVSELKKTNLGNYPVFKYRLKNCIKRCIPLIAYNLARDIWIRYFK